MRLKVCFISLCLSLFVSPAATASPQDYSFTYQGQLQDNGSPANGLHNFRVTPVDEFDFELGQTLVFTDVSVVDGLFTLDLDFADTILTTEKVFLKIFVGHAGGESIELTPRTLIHSAPFAIQAQAASYADTASSAFISFDNEFTRVGDMLNLGDTNETLLVNPDISGGSFIDSTTRFQFNFNNGGYGSMFLSGSQPNSVPRYAFAVQGNPFGWFEAEPANDTMNFYFAGETSPIMTLKPKHVETKHIVIKDGFNENGTIVADYGNEEYHNAMPVAYGTFDQNGNQFSGTENLSAEWDAGSNLYRLTLAGETFNFTNFTASVTPIGSIPRFATTTSGLSKLTINMFDLNGNRVQESFQVIIYDNRRVSVD